MPYVDTAAMQTFLDRFSETLAEDDLAVMVLDQAGWHGSAALAVPGNVVLVPLPPYSPELNPVERVWLYLKERFLSHRLLEDYDAIVTAACNAWNRLVAEIGELCRKVGDGPGKGRRRIVAVKAGHISSKGSIRHENRYNRHLAPAG
jgi:transposase